jgi:hypothetical protein
VKQRGGGNEAVVARRQEAGGDPGFVGLARYKLGRALAALLALDQRDGSALQRWMMLVGS